MVSLMQKEGKTDNRKTMNTFLSDDLSAPSKSLEYAKINNEKFWNYVLIFLDFSSIHQQTLHSCYTHAS